MNAILGAAGNQVSGSMDLTVTLTADNDAGTAAVSDVNIIRACGKGSATGLPAGVTMTGDFTSFAELQDSLQKTGINITAIVLESDDTTHFTGTKKLTLKETQPNGRAVQEASYQLSKYKESDGSGTNTTLTFVPPTGSIFVTPRTNLAVQLNKNKSMTVTFYYDYAETKRPIAAN